jgi:hypothetical protein
LVDKGNASRALWPVLEAAMGSHYWLELFLQQQSMPTLPAAEASLAHWHFAIRSRTVARMQSTAPSATPLGQAAA